MEYYIIVLRKQSTLSKLIKMQEDDLYMDSNLRKRNKKREKTQKTRAIILVFAYSFSISKNLTFQYIWATQKGKTLLFEFATGGRPAGGKDVRKSGVTRFTFGREFSIILCTICSASAFGTDFGRRRAPCRPGLLEPGAGAVSRRLLLAGHW